MVAINKLASQIIRSYDRNGDGVIDVNKGKQFEGARWERTVWDHHNYEEIILTEYTNDKLFAKADANGDKLITKEEMMAVLDLFDKNNDGQLKNKGPFWNRKGELKNFEKEYQAKGEIIDRRIIYKPQPPPYHPYPRAIDGLTVGRIAYA